MLRRSGSTGGDDMGACCGVAQDGGKGDSAFRTRSANSRPRYKVMEGTTEERSSKVEAKSVPVVQDLKPEETSSASLIETVESVTDKARETPAWSVSHLSSRRLRRRRVFRYTAR